MAAADIRTEIRNAIQQNRKFMIIDVSGRCWNDMIIPDASSDTVFRFLAKYNQSPFVMEEPTFGDASNPVGMVEMAFFYETIGAILYLDISNGMMEKFKQQYPGRHEFWSNANKVDYAQVPISVKV